MANTQTLEIPISGMDCAECTQHVQHAIEKLPGVQSVNVFLGTEKAVVKLDPTQVDIPEIRSAVRGAEYDVPASHAPKAALSFWKYPIEVDKSSDLYKCV